MWMENAGTKVYFTLIARNGSMALLDGGLRQLGELAGYGLVALVAYLLLRACEKVLVERILD